MIPDILVLLFTYDRYELLKESLETMFRNPGMDFRLWVVDNGSFFSNLYSSDSGEKQLNLLLEYYKYGKTEHLYLNKTNEGINHALNELMAVARLTSEVPKIITPDFVFSTNDDIIYEDGWLLESYNALMDCSDYPNGRIVVSSPFHCMNPAFPGVRIPTLDTWKGREIIDNVCGNTWLMSSDVWLNTFGWYPVHSSTDDGDWAMLDKMNTNGWHAVLTKKEFAHHSEQAVGKGKYNRLSHW